MKITIKIDPETLFLLHKIIAQESQMIATTRARRSGKSMRLELFSQLSQKCISYTAKQNGKKLSLTLKYHLADLVLDIVSDLQYSLGVYENNKLEILKNELHKMLQ